VLADPGASRPARPAPRLAPRVLSPTSTLLGGLDPGPAVAQAAQQQQQQEQPC